MKAVLFVTALLLSSFASSAHAADFDHELSPLTIGHYTVALRGTAPIAHVFALGSKYFYNGLHRNLQFGVASALGWGSSAGVSATLWQTIGSVGVTGLGADIRSDAFLRVGLGFNFLAANGGSTGSFALQFEGGKRCPLTESISWTPHIQSTTQINTRTDIAFVPISFSMFF